MGTITQYFSIDMDDSDIPFVNVHVDTDTKLYLDPYDFENLNDSGFYFQEAKKHLEDFTSTIIRAILDDSQNSQYHGKNILQNFHEPREIRLGESKNGYNGKGSGEHFCSEIWEVLTTDLRALIRVGILRQLSALPIYIENFDRDRMSDMTAGIIRGVLADFTTEMMEKFPEFSMGEHSTVQHCLQVWDLEQHQWSTREVELPQADGYPLLLIPKEWASPRIELRSSRFYDVAVLGHLQAKLYAANPKAGKVAKKRILNPYSSKIEANRIITLQAYAVEINLLDHFVKWAGRSLEKRNEKAA